MTNSKMPEAIKAEWVEKLRSGNFLQSKRGKLHIVDGTEDKYCCLGVLSAIARDHGLVECFALRLSRGAGVMIARYDDNETYLPKGIQDWSQLNFDDQQTLARMNDGNCDFNEIAEYIDEHL